MKILLLLIFLAACGKTSSAGLSEDPVSKEIRKQKTTDPEFETYVVEFEFEYGKSVKHIPINFGDLEYNKIGTCYSWDSGKKEIEIDRDWWDDRSTDSERVVLIFHELGHCALNRSHRNDKRDDDCPGSIMNSVVIKDDCYLDHEESLIKELFDF